MTENRFAQMNCSLARTASITGDAWTILILRDVFVGVNRFDDLAADLGISRNLLTTRLRQLVEDGILETVAYSEHPPRNRYVLSPAGKELVPPLLALMAWGDRWKSGEGREPLIIRHRKCRSRTTPQVCCSECGEPLVADAIRILPGPGGSVGPGTAIVGQRLMDRYRRR